MYAFTSIPTVPKNTLHLLTGRQHILPSRLFVPAQGILTTTSGVVVPARKLYSGPTNTPAVASSSIAVSRILPGASRRRRRLVSSVVFSSARRIVVSATKTFFSY